MSAILQEWRGRPNGRAPNRSNYLSLTKHPAGRASLNVQTSNPQSFLMGSDKHTTNEISNLTMFEKNHQFYVAPNSFPLIEDGIIGLPFLTKYQYSVTNNKLTLDEIILPFQKTNNKIRLGKTLTSTQYIEGKPTAVCFINTGKQICHITNEIEKPGRLSQINKFAQTIRTRHIDPELREPIEKILINYLDVFNMETDSLPCTSLIPCTNKFNRLKFKYRNLPNLTRQLKLLLRYRSKRGLLNVIGSVSKTLFGTLDEKDLELINKNIDTLFDSNNKIKTIIGNQTALIKRVLDDTKTNQIENLASDIHKIENHNEKNEILVSLLIQTESTMSEFHTNIDEIFNTVMLGKQGIINPQVIEPEQFFKTLDRITRQNFMTNHIEPSVQNFQLILDLSKLKVWIRDNKLIYTITVPLLENNEWKITKIYPILSKQNSVFIAPVIETDLILTNSEQYTFADSHYLNKYCKRTAIIHICKRTQPNHNRINSTECRSELISNQQTVKTCPTAVFKLEELTFAPLQTENHYIIISIKNVQIDVLCKTHKTLEIRQLQA